VTGFRCALVLYPACGLKGQFENGIVPYAPVRVFQGSADEEVSPKRCAELVDKSWAAGGEIVLTLYAGATHDFDDPGPERRGNPANVEATSDVTPRAAEFLPEFCGVTRVDKVRAR
jgi:dienelactone hydrolase